MKVYASPIPYSFDECMVDGRFSVEAMAASEQRYTGQVEAWLRENGYHHKLTGHIVRFPVADGAAQYMIANGTTLIHLPLGDAWQIPAAHARGLRISDIQAEITRAAKFRALAAKST
jgi:hypothetical protein